MNGRGGRTDRLWAAVRRRGVDGAGVAMGVTDSGSAVVGSSPRLLLVLVLAAASLSGSVSCRSTDRTSERGSERVIAGIADIADVADVADIADTADTPSGSPLATEKHAPRPLSFPEYPGADLSNGERIYREGIGHAGEVAAVVSGDVEIGGSALRCVSCHQRSGMGTSEGWTVVPMVTARALFSEKRAGKRPRPAYDRDSLARVLVDGIDVAGDPLDPLMPRYALDETDLRDLSAYLAQLSRDVSPGVEAEVLHLATVVGPDVDARPMLDVLERFTDEKNNDLRNPVARARSGAYFRKHRDQAYRKWRLHVWRLEGDRSTWQAQLARFQRERPVFALLSGQVSGSWDPIERFCEENEIPCLLPNTDRIGSDRDQRWTVYFSGGTDLEAATIADRLATTTSGGRLLLIGRTGDRTAEVARREARRRGLTVIDALFPVDEPVRARTIARQVEIHVPDAVAIWLPRRDLLGVARWLESDDPACTVFLSSSDLGDLDRKLPPSLTRCATLVHPFTMPAEFERRFLRVSAWLRRAEIEIRDRRVQAQSYYACMLLGEALMHFRHDFYYRDFLLESVDHIIGLPAFSIAHPTPSFGPGQRLLSKGCHLLAPGGWESGHGSRWVVPEIIDRPPE